MGSNQENLIEYPVTKDNPLSPHTLSHLKWIKIHFEKP